MPIKYSSKDDNKGRANLTGMDDIMRAFPVCKHAKRKATIEGGLLLLASEPFRVFFFSGVVWSMIGVLLWPLFYAGWLGFFPNLAHARLMIEAFGGAFVVGFLGTAGPRMASAPKLTRVELGVLFALHQAGAICHLRLQHGWGDRLFTLLLLSLLLMLVIRLTRFRKEMPPPQMLLALTGLGCGIAGTMLFGFPELAATPERYQLAGLLLYQGLLLVPVLGIGSFLFPRILGGAFGEPGSATEVRQKAWRAVAASVLVVGSFWVEVYVSAMIGGLLRVAVAVGYLGMEVRWRARSGDAPRGTLAKGLVWALGAGMIGLLMAAVFPVQRVSVGHLLFVSGFGLLMLVVGSRVLFGHSGELAGFEQKSWMARAMIFLALLAAATRATTGFLPQLTVTHHVYAALTWAAVGGLWLKWHWRRFGKRGD
jgi:uncharacterized protein involved in response to NO